MHAIDLGAGTPLILIHGFGVDHRILVPLDPVLQSAGTWRRIYLDLPGTAGTPIGGAASTSDVVAAVEREIDARIGDEPFAILGNSFGGMIARQVATTSDLECWDWRRWPVSSCPSRNDARFLRGPS